MYPLIVLDGKPLRGKEIKEYPKNRGKLIEHLIQRWGKPDKVSVGERVVYGAYYVIELEWDKGEVFMEMECPIAVNEYIKSTPLLTKLLGKLFGQDGVLTQLVITVDQSMKKFYKRQPEPSRYYKPVGIAETERLLKSIKYYEILEQSLKTQNSNQAVGGR